MNPIDAASDGWTVSPYPDGYRFAFTIVHDADSAYSRRLAPLFDCFDELGLKITATVFPFWAKWARGGRSWENWRQQDLFFSPIAVPLEDDEERRFYLDLAARGHEIAMHTPSETSSTREQVIRSFEFFESVFGAPPRVYVEHSPRNNLDAQSRSGSDPSTAYYNTDLLNASGCWIWVCDPRTDLPVIDRSSYNVLAGTGSPFSAAAFDIFGIERGFLRCGRRPANGDGFLELFSLENIDALEREGGLALLYTHLDFGWLDSESRQIRAPIRDRLAEITGRNGWFVPAADILDRFRAIEAVTLSFDTEAIEIVNRSGVSLPGLTVIAPRGQALLCDGVTLCPDQFGRIVVGTLGADESLKFGLTRSPD